MITTNVSFEFDERRLLRIMDQSKMRALDLCGALVERDAKRSMSPGGGSGHEPSAPGEPPHVQLGTLWRSLTHARTNKETVLVGPTVLYGRPHEKGGTFTGPVRTVTFPARPFMRPALERQMLLFPVLFKEIMR